MIQESYKERKEKSHLRHNWNDFRIKKMVQITLEWKNPFEACYRISQSFQLTTIESAFYADIRTGNGVTNNISITPNNYAVFGT